MLPVSLYCPFFTTTSFFCNVYIDIQVHSNTRVEENRISDLMVSALASSAVDCRFEPDRVKPKTIKLVFVSFPLSMQH
jgi:hypothetical protein